MSSPIAEMKLEEFSHIARAIEAEVAKVIVGQGNVVRAAIVCILAGRHALLEGVPGLGKTMLIKTLADVLELNFSRIQFTPDLMPADITGTDILEEDEHGRRRRFQAGPIFANLVLADEINRATPKTQAAMLEAMQEKTVTIFGRQYPLELPFFVLATQNPLEMEGVYPLPEAQLDRFFLKVDVQFPNVQELIAIIDRTTGSEFPTAKRVTGASEIVRMGHLALNTPIASHLSEYVARLIMATHPESNDSTVMVRQYLSVGASPRGAQALVIGAKINALLEGRFNVSYEDIEAMAHGALCHRLLLNFEGQAEGIKTDAIISDLLKTVKRK